MGIFKSIKNFVTGGSAEVTIELSEHTIKRGESMEIRVIVHAVEDILLERVEVNLKAIEETIKSVTLHEEVIELDSNIQMRKEDSKNWTTTISIPKDAVKSWRGKHSSMHWYINAEIELPGLNPDSNWEKIYVV